MTDHEIGDKPHEELHAADLVVVVPALNEAAGIQNCIRSLVDQEVRITVLVSDNSSEDETAFIARAALPNAKLIVRTIERLRAVEHFVSAGRWALSATTADVFAILAGDDSWSPGFAHAALDALSRHPDVDVVYPTFVWEGDGIERVLVPPSFAGSNPFVRKCKALLLPDYREIGNLVFGVYRRAAFEDMLRALESAGDQFGSDYAAIISILTRHRVSPVPSAVSRRNVRAGADLLERVGMSRGSSAGWVSTARAYVRLNVRINHRLAIAIGLLENVGWRPTIWQLQAIRTPQWLWGALRHARAGNLTPS